MTKPPANVTEYGLRCAEAARDEFVNWESASGTALMLDEKPPAAPSIAAIVAGVPLPEQVPCTWTTDEDGGWWTSCGEAFAFRRAPDPRGFAFCCYCGRKLAPSPADAQTGEGES